MRVVLVAPRAVPGGAERLVAALARTLPPEGVRVEALVGERGPLVDWLLGAGCPTTVSTGRGPAASAVVARADVVLSIGATGHVMGGALASEAGVPAVWWRTLTPRGRGYEAQADATPAAAVICCSLDALRWQRSQRSGPPAVRIPPGADVSGLRTRAGEGRGLRHRLQLGPRPVVGMVARIDPIKRQDLFLRAAALVSERFPEAVFMVVGGDFLDDDGRYVGGLRTLATTLGIAGHVHQTGHVDDQVPWMAAMDVVVSASDHECFGLSTVEAMALGRPVVTTDTHGGRATVVDGVSGSIVPVGDVGALAGAVCTLLADPVLATAQGEAGRRRAARYDERLVARAVSRLVRRVAGRPGRPTGGRAGSAAVPAGSAPTA